MESSNDLVNWTKRDEIYGMGNEYVVTMRQFAAAPPLEPGVPPATLPGPSKNASLMLRPASGEAGGTVVSWASLDDGGPVIVRIAGAMDPAWDQIPMFVDRYGDYEFCASHPGGNLPPPAENPPLGTHDSAMLAVLEASLPAMNLQVANSVVRARNAPAPAPANPDATRFWRILVNPDIDTDLDGSPDWAEFEIAAREAAVRTPRFARNSTGEAAATAAPARGDAFNPDTNNNGIPDGEELDADQDGTPDAKDPDASDNTAVFPLAPLPRYALFPITNAQPPEDVRQALQINDNGRVLYENGTWSAGEWTPLAAPAENGAGGDPQSPFAISINDNDVILGTCWQQVGPNAIEGASVRCFWGTPSAAPRLVQSNINLGSGYAGGFTYSLAFHGLTFQQQLSNDNRFTARSCTWVPDPDGGIGKEISQPAVWTLPSGSSPLSTHAGMESSIEFHRSPDISWGYTVERDEEGFEIGEQKGRVLAPGALPELPFIPYNVIPFAGGFLALPPPYSDQSPQALINGKWQDSVLYKHAFDMADDGTAIALNHDLLTAPIILNGKSTGIERTAPGLPFDWRDSTVTLLDTTPGGWILAGRGANVPPIEHAVMLPIKVDGVDPDVIPPPLPPAPGTPPFDPPEFLAGGVDHTSMMAESGSGRVQEIWIMAPTGSSNKVRFRSPLNDKCKLKLPSNFDVEFSPETIDGKNKVIQVKALVVTGSSFPALKLGGTLDALGHPLAVKAMKRRTLKIAVHPVALKRADDDAAYPSRIPSNSVEDRNDFKQKLTEYLDNVYGRQVNLFFDIDVLSAVEVDFDNVEPFGETEITNGSAFTPEMTIACTNPQWPSGLADIDIWILGGTSLVAGPQKYLGMKTGGTFGINPASPTPYIIVDGSGSVGGVIAHEMGHIFMNGGHPDVKEDNHFARLEGISQKDRLMKHVVSENSSCQLIKKEWDKIEDWLRAWEKAK